MVKDLMLLGKLSRWFESNQSNQYPIRLEAGHLAFNQKERGQYPYGIPKYLTACLFYSIIDTLYNINFPRGNYAEY